MQLKPIIQGLAVVWLVLFVFSFVSLQTTPVGDGETGALNRVAVFLTWQTVAFIVATVGALTTRFAVGRGADGVRLVGYLPLALSVFLVALFVALVGFRLFVVPIFE